MTNQDLIGVSLLLLLGVLLVQLRRIQMHQFKIVSAIAVSVILAGCGGGGSDLPAKPKFTSHVSFGDSLSDVGTYNVGFVAASGVGTAGQFSINGPNGNGKAANGNNITNWTEVVSASLGLPAPCPAVTGLDDGTATQSLNNVTVTPNLNCTGYAQGGARVNELNGVHNVLNGTYATATGLGGVELTYPVVKQIANYHTDHGNFSGNELVSVVVGGNDLQYQLQMLIAGAVQAAITAQVTADVIAGTCTAAPPYTACVPAAIGALGGSITAIKLNLTTNVAGATYLSAHATDAVTAMGVAAGQLVGDVNTLLTQGAKHVVVASIPDFADIPALAPYPASTKALVDLMVTTFNSTLKTGLAGLAGSANVVYVDTYTSIKDEIKNPAKYNLTNTTSQVCDPVKTPNNRALFCNKDTLITGQTADTHYLFSDDTHPTPYGHALFGQYVLQTMLAKGWY